MIGLCCTPQFYPKPAHLATLKPPYLRSILYKLDDIDTLLDLGKSLIITLNNQCAEVGFDWAHWNTAIFSLCKRLESQNKLKQLLVLEAGNELDLFSDTPASFASDIALRAARICRQFNIKVAPTPVAGPNWPQYLKDLAQLCGSEMDYFGIHPYGQRPDGWHDNTKWMHGDLRDVIKTVKDITHKPVICSEYGVKIKDAGSEQEVALFLKAANDCIKSLDISLMSWFAYEDAVGAPSEQGTSAFGLVSSGGVLRPAYHTYAAIHEGEAPDVPTDWSDKVGRGLLDMMRQDNTSPAMASEWRPFDRPQGTAATIEQCIGLNNVTYCYNLNTSSGWRIRPS